jgi:hypothetical protein
MHVAPGLLAGLCLSPATFSVEIREDLIRAMLPSPRSQPVSA